MLGLSDTLENLHHAYLLEGEMEIVFQELLEFLEKQLNFSVKANPDFWLGDFDSLGIDDSRTIKNFQVNKSFSVGKKILVIKTNFITHEAQNSLLKVFEEPTSDTHLFLIMPSGEGLLPTLKSRLMVVRMNGEAGQQLGRPTSKLEVEEFLKADLTKRSELIKVFLPKSKEEKADKAGAIDFLNKLEWSLYQDFEKKRATACLPNRQAPPPPSTSEMGITFSEIRQGRSYLNDRSPSVKMILEHLSQIISVKI